MSSSDFGGPTSTQLLVLALRSFRLTVPIGIITMHNCTTSLLYVLQTNRTPVGKAHFDTVNSTLSPNGALSTDWALLDIAPTT